jgi:hypothetical protein
LKANVWIIFICIYCCFRHINKISTLALDRHWRPRIWSWRASRLKSREQRMRSSTYRSVNSLYVHTT